MLRPPTNQTFCILPWVHLAASVDGVWGRCCVDSSMYYEQYYRLEEKPLITLRSDSVGCVRHSAYAETNPDKIFNLLEAFNSPSMRKTRLAMLNGERVPACDYCYRREQGGGKSYRHIANEMFGGFTGADQFVSSTSPEGFVDQFPMYLDIRFGNTCNLACIMCNFPVSSRWGAKSDDRQRESRIDPYNEDSELWDILEQNVQRLRRIYFAGGEPFLQPMHFRLIDLILKWNCADQIDLAYSTNLTTLPHGIFEKLKKFKSVDIGASCDGIGRVYEEIRVGAKWRVFVNNVRRTRIHFPVRLAVTTQKSNISQLDEIIKWGINEKCELDLTNILMIPEELSIKCLTADDKKKYVEKYRSLAYAYDRNGFHKLAVDLNNVVNFMMAGETNGWLPD